MEAEQTEMDSRTDNLAVTEQSNFYEAIPIDNLRIISGGMIGDSNCIGTNLNG